jgi:4'-phosphopantetheinyl transferase EntD
MLGKLKASGTKTLRAARMSAKSSIVDSPALLLAWRSLLPEDIFISAGPLLDKATPLTERERASIGPVDDQRLREFESGRVYAKQALALIGFHEVELPIASDRSPAWPAGAIGSLTHVMGRDGGHFAAAVARRDAVDGVGIDIERENGLHPRLWDQVLTPRERQRVLRLPVPARGIEAQIVWCAKEAAGKAVRHPIEPTELEIENDPDGDGYTVTWRHAIGKTARSTHSWHGRMVRSQGFILTAVVRPRGSKRFGKALGI